MVLIFLTGLLLFLYLSVILVEATRKDRSLQCQLGFCSRLIVTILVSGGIAISWDPGCPVNSMNPGASSRRGSGVNAVSSCNPAKAEDAKFEKMLVLQRAWVLVT